jgi:MYXO-CTERM domain-containing protein
MRHAGWVGLGVTAFFGWSANAAAATVCGTIDEFNAAMAADGTTSSDVTLTYDLVGVKPTDFHNTKGSLGQMRNTQCAAGQDAAIKVYGTSDVFNTSHPPGTLKLEYGNQCCGGDCGERWADPNASAVIFNDGSEQCQVTMWVKPDSIGYKLECGGTTFDAVGGNPESNVVDQVAVLKYYLGGGGTTWELPNATATNVKLCYVTGTAPVSSMNLGVAEDVTATTDYPTSVFPNDQELEVATGYAEVFLKFVVPATVGTVTAARLFMHTNLDPSANGDGGEVYTVTSHQWSETTLTWDTRPERSANSHGRIGPAAGNEWVSLDLGTAITAPGTYSFAVAAPAAYANGTHFYSKEGSPTNAPYLRLSYDPSAGGAGGAGDGGSSGDPGTGGSAEGGNGWGAGTSSSGGAGASTGVPRGSAEEADDAGGCGCRIAGGGGRSWLALAFAMLLVLARRRRP